MISQAMKRKETLHCQYQKRTKTKIIRYRRYDIQQEEMDYYREQLMLYIPFRDERKDILDCDIKFMFDLLSDQILETRNLYQSSQTGRNRTSSGTN